MKVRTYEFKVRRVPRTFEIPDDAPIQLAGAPDAARLAKALTDGEPRELFLAFALDVKNSVIGVEVVAIGSVSSVDVHPREVFRAAMLAGASGVVVAHNHPTDDPRPSAQDDAVTTRLAYAGELVGLPVLDHVIVTETGGCYSYAHQNSGLLCSATEQARIDIRTAVAVGSNR